MRLKLTVSYQGDAFTGWQSQPQRTTVQDVLEDTLKRILHHRVVVHGSGRTDSGVHALGQVAHCEVTDRFSVEEWQRILNYNLPPTVRILKCQLAPPKFHARFSAEGKVYRYIVCNQSVLPPLDVKRAWLVPHKIDMALLRETAQLFVGRHDFVGFAANRGDQPKTTVRTIHRVTVSRRGSLISLTFHGEGFLYKMVRMLTGAIIRVATGREDIANIVSRLETGKPRWSYVAPADGLYLVKVIY